MKYKISKNISYVRKYKYLKMMILMGLSLLVYSIGQRQLRNRLKEEGEAIKNQVNKLTERPTLRWIFQCFQGIHVFEVRNMGYIYLNKNKGYIIPQDLDDLSQYGI